MKTFTIAPFAFGVLAVAQTTTAVPGYSALTSAESLASSFVPSSYTSIVETTPSSAASSSTTAVVSSAVSSTTAVVTPPSSSTSTAAPSTSTTPTYASCTAQEDTCRTAPNANQAFCSSQLCSCLASAGALSQGPSYCQVGTTSAIVGATTTVPAPYGGSNTTIATATVSPTIPAFTGAASRFFAAPVVGAVGVLAMLF